jgi:hypothetical protein
MNRTANSFFIVDCSKEVNTALPLARADELSRVILHTIGAANESFQQATRRLLRLAELAHGARDYVALQAISSALDAIPFEPAHRAATYYAAIIAKRDGHLDTAAAMLESLSSPRAIQTLATVRELQGQWEEAARLHAQAMRRAKDVDGLALVNARAQLAIIKSVAGDHHAALADLQDLWSMVRVLAKTHPHLYPQWCNALALELNATGEIEAAQRAIAVAVASPIVDCYPEWRETAREVAPARVMVVVIAPEASEPQETRTLMFRFHIAESTPHFHHLAIIHTRLLNPRAGPRGPPSWFECLR